MLRKRTFRRARKNRKYKNLILLTVLFGAMSLVGALSYGSASEANQKYIKTENDKLRLLEEQFDAAKSTEGQVKIQNINAKVAAEQAVKNEEIARQKATEEAARQEIEKAQKNILEK